MCLHYQAATNNANLSGEPFVLLLSSPKFSDVATGNCPCIYAQDTACRAWRCRDTLLPSHLSLFLAGAILMAVWSGLGMESVSARTLCLSDVHETTSLAGVSKAFGARTEGISGI